MRPNPQETADLVKFTEEILSGKLRFLCSVYYSYTKSVKPGIKLETFQFVGECVTDFVIQAYSNKSIK